MAFGKIRCPTCSAAIEISQEEAKNLEFCPACKDYIRQKLIDLGVRVGITTATVSGPNMRPIGDTLIQDVY